MKDLRRKLEKITFIKYYMFGKTLQNHPVFLEGQEKNKIEKQKTTSRTDVLNYLLSHLNRETTYLEIGIHNPEHNYNKIKADIKYSVDPGIEFPENPADFKITSDEFFAKLDNNEILTNDIKFDVIFIDGLHLADQVDKDIINAFRYIKEDGFIVLHDCNPPTIWHAREDIYYFHTPAGRNWNGSTWKAFLKWRSDNTVNSCCIDADWGVGILSKKHSIGKSIEPSNLFYEFNMLDKNRSAYLNLMHFDDFKKIIEKELPQH